MLPLLFLLPLAHAHFLLNTPPTIGFDDDLESTPPCGSFTPSLSSPNLTDFHAGGDAIAITSTHPAATWLFRATLDPAGLSNWTSLLPAVAQTGLGDYCETGVMVPEEFVGKKGVLGVVQDAADGLLYQCAVVSFIAGPAPSLPSNCKNVTGLSAVYTSDATLSAVPASATAMMSGSATGSVMASTAGAPAPSGSATKSGAVVERELGWGTGWAVGVAVLVAGAAAAGGV